MKKCSLCSKAGRYLPIDDSLEKTLKDNNFPYNLNDFETLSYKTYTCSQCGSSDRDRLYKIYFDVSQVIQKNSKVLDFAPSQQLENYLRSTTKKYRSADLYIKNVDDKVDITDMKDYKDNSFDFFICSHILEHVDDDKAALSELYRVLKPGGKGIVMTPIIDKSGVQDEDPKVKNKKTRIRRFAQDDHVRLYEKTVFLQRVQNAGFKIHTYSYWNLGVLNFLRNGIRFKSKLYVVEK